MDARADPIARTAIALRTVATDRTTITCIRVKPSSACVRWNIWLVWYLFFASILASESHILLQTARLMKPVRSDVEQQTCQPQFWRKTKSFYSDSALLLSDLLLKVTTKGKPLHSPRARAACPPRTDQVNCHGFKKPSDKGRNSEGLGRLDRTEGHRATRQEVLTGSDSRRS